jgi:hypothetical protein
MSWRAQSRSKDAKTPSAARALSEKPELDLWPVQPYLCCRAVRSNKSLLHILDSAHAAGLYHPRVYSYSYPSKSAPVGCHPHVPSKYLDLDAPHPHKILGVTCVCPCNSSTQIMSCVPCPHALPLTGLRSYMIRPKVVKCGLVRAIRRWTLSTRWLCDKTCTWPGS